LRETKKQEKTKENRRFGEETTKQFNNGKEKENANESL